MKLMPVVVWVAGGREVVWVAGGRSSWLATLGTASTIVTFSLTQSRSSCLAASITPGPNPGNRDSPLGLGPGKRLRSRYLEG